MNAIIIEASPIDVDQRRQAFALLAVSLKRDIARLPNGRWEAIVNLGPVRFAQALRSDAAGYRKRD